MRTAGLIATGAVAVHELRYILAGSAADPGAGHGYLPLAGLVSAVLLGVACAQLVAVVERARRTGRAEDAGRSLRCSARRDREPPGFLATWLLMALALTLIFFAQELLEGLVAGRHGTSLDGVLAQGGSIAAPLALGVGGLLALAVVGARSAVAAAARRARRTAARGSSAVRLRPSPGHRSAGSPLARHLAGRAPPYVLR